VFAALHLQAASTICQARHPAPYRSALDGVTVTVHSFEIDLGAYDMKRRSAIAWATALLFCAAAVLLLPGLIAPGDVAAQTAPPQITHTEHLSAGTGQPIQGQMTLQNPVTPVAEEINRFHGMVNKIIIAIAAFVLALMIYVMFRFNAKANPTPSRTTHHAGLEVAWTVIPILILVVISIPSFRLLFFQYSFPKPDLTIKAIGNAWFWEHEYADEKIKVTSNMITDDEVAKAKLGEAELNKRLAGLSDMAKIRLVQDVSDPIWKGVEKAPTQFGEGRLVRQLSVDNDIAVPVGKVVHLLITSNDVIHSWTIPSFGSKMQAVPGRITATWFRADKIGVYYGQCSVLCGKAHSGMPIAVRVVADKDYAAWVEAAKARDWKKARGILQSATAHTEPKTLAASSQ
jgi:cytochrome c oxidase subunit II